MDWVGVRGHLAFCFGLFAEGCAMASVQGLLEAREVSTREWVEVLREEAARAAAALEAGEIEWECRVIAREERRRISSHRVIPRALHPMCPYCSPPRPVPTTSPIALLAHQRHQLTCSLRTDPQLLTRRLRRDRALVEVTVPSVFPYSTRQPRIRHFLLVGIRPARASVLAPCTSMHE